MPIRAGSVLKLGEAYHTKDLEIAIQGVLTKLAILMMDVKCPGMLDFINRLNNTFTGLQRKILEEVAVNEKKRPPSLKFCHK